MNAIELIAALKGADEETAMELVERLQCGEIDCSVLPTGKDNAVQQAQIWAQEARTQKGIVEEIGKLVGCANDWEMVGAVKAALSANGGEVEPVAWAVFADNGNIRIWGREKPEAFPDAAPLYLSPTVKESLTVQSEPIGYADPDTLADYRAGDRLHMPVYRPDASADWQDGIPVYLHPAPPSVAVPEGWKLAPIEPTCQQVEDGAQGIVSWEDGAVWPDSWASDQAARARNDARKSYCAMLAAAPSPDHPGEANKLVTPKLFKAFHASLCRRFGYTHDEQYWWRDLVSLEEHIAAKVADHIADAGKVDEDRRCSHGIRHPHPCRECEDAPLSIAEAGKVAPVSIPDSEFDETNPIHQAADAYSYACEIMEQHQSERVAAGKDPGTIGSLCDGIAWLYEYIQELEAATPSVPENEVKARALEEYAYQLDAVFANAQEAGATDCPAWHAGQFAKDARKQAARLRTAGDEGEETHG